MFVIQKFLFFIYLFIYFTFLLLHKFCQLKSKLDLAGQVMVCVHQSDQSGISSF